MNAEAVVKQMWHIVYYSALLNKPITKEQFFKLDAAARQAGIVGLQSLEKTLNR